MFTDINPDGTWSLYAMDPVSGDSTDIANGWRLNIDVVGGSLGNEPTFKNENPIVIPGPATVPEPGTLALVLFGIAGMAGYRLWRQLAE